MANGRLSANPNDRGDGAGLVLFFALTFGWTWALWWGAARVMHAAPITASVLQVLGGLGPSAAAVAVVALRQGRSGLRRWLARCLAWRVGWLRMVLALVLPACVMGWAAWLHLALGGTLPDSPARGHLMLVALNFVLVLGVGGPLGEEFGWRGYALPAMQARWGWRTASLALGIAWAAWHLPLFYGGDTVQSHLPLGLFAASIVAASVVFAWLYNQTPGSVLPVLLLHTAINAWPLLIPVLPTPDGKHPQPLQWLVATLVLIAAVLLARPAHRGPISA